MNIKKDKQITCLSPVVIMNFRIINYAIIDIYIAKKDDIL